MVCALAFCALRVDPTATDRAPSSSLPNRVPNGVGQSARAMQLNLLTTQGATLVLLRAGDPSSPAPGYGTVYLSLCAPSPLFHSHFSCIISSLSLSSRSSIEKGFPYPFAFVGAFSFYHHSSGAFPIRFTERASWQHHHHPPDRFLRHWASATPVLL